MTQIEYILEKINQAIQSNVIDNEFSGGYHRGLRDACNIIKEVTDKPERSTGYYWVELHGHKIIAEYFDMPICWYISGEIESLEDSAFTWIDENRLCKPDQK